MPPKDQARNDDHVHIADEIVQTWGEDAARIKAWGALRTKIDEAIDLMDTEYLELNDLHDPMLFRAARYAQDFLEDCDYMRDAVIAAMQREGQAVEGERYDGLINGRGHNPVMYSQAKALVIETVQRTIVVKQEVRRLREWISDDVWKGIREETYERRKKVGEQLSSKVTA